ncbi:hypothetical protein ACLI1A_12155 [Flavobacterium sp. RHBU_3]|uniref:hypothetical protein n=1 Tax=Flavobacterium sp. RHBU_3 TaxID=3391184 RepID=UPI003984AF03
MLPVNDLTAVGAILAAALMYVLATVVIKFVFRQKKEDILSRYSRLRRQSIDLQTAMSGYLLEGNTGKNPIDGELTFADFYRQMKSNHISNLSDKYLSRVKKSNNPLFLTKVEKNLEEQEQKLKDAEQLIATVVAI